MGALNIDGSLKFNGNLHCTLVNLVPLVLNINALAHDNRGHMGKAFDGVSRELWDRPLRRSCPTSVPGIIHLTESPSGIGALCNP